MREKIKNLLFVIITAIVVVLLSIFCVDMHNRDKELDEINVNNSIKISQRKNVNEYNNNSITFFAEVVSSEPPSLSWDLHYLDTNIFPEDCLLLEISDDKLSATVSMISPFYDTCEIVVRFNNLTASATIDCKEYVVDYLPLDPDILTIDGQVYLCDIESMENGIIVPEEVTYESLFNNKNVFFNKLLLNVVEADIVGSYYSDDFEYGYNRYYTISLSEELKSALIESNIPFNYVMYTYTQTNINIYELLASYFGENFESNYKVMFALSKITRWFDIEYTFDIHIDGDVYHSYKETYGIYFQVEIPAPVMEYTGTYIGEAEYLGDGVYYVEVNFKQWNRIQFSINDKPIEVVTFDKTGIYGPGTNYTSALYYEYYDLTATNKEINPYLLLTYTGGIYQITIDMWNESISVIHVNQ